MTWYTVYNQPDHWLVQKVDPEDRSPLTNIGQGRLSAYKVMRINGYPARCNCAARVAWCRHKAMVVLFNNVKRVDSRWLYNYDKDWWIQPFTLEM